MIYGFSERVINVQYNSTFVNDEMYTEFNAHRVITAKCDSTILLTVPTVAGVHDVASRI